MTLLSLFTWSFVCLQGMHFCDTERFFGKCFFDTTGRPFIPFALGKALRQFRTWIKSHFRSFFYIYEFGVLPDWWINVPQVQNSPHVGSAWKCHQCCWQHQRQHHDNCSRRHDHDHGHFCYIMVVVFDVAPTWTMKLWQGLPGIFGSGLGEALEANPPVFRAGGDGHDVGW